MSSVDIFPMQGISNLPLSIESYIIFNEEKYYIVFMPIQMIILIILIFFQKSNFLIRGKSL